MLLHLGNQIHLLLSAPRTEPLCLPSFARNLAVSIQPPLFSWHRATIAKDERRKTNGGRERVKSLNGWFRQEGKSAHAEMADNEEEKKMYGQGGGEIRPGAGR
jgi:hypothetical protein